MCGMNLMRTNQIHFLIKYKVINVQNKRT